MKDKVNLIEEMNRMKNLFGYKAGKVISEQEINPSNILNEQSTPGGVKQDAINKILAISKQNKAKLSGSYLAPLQQSDIDNEFGVGTYSKFFNNGGKDILDAKKIEPKKNNSKPQIVIPSGVSQDAVNKILAISKQNKAGLQGSYLFPPQQNAIDVEFGQGTYNKFFYGGGEDVLKGTKIFKPISAATPATKPASKPAAKPATIKPVVNPTIPKELKDVNGVKKFQEWLNTKNPTWVNGKPLELDPERGYGRFGPRTSKAWSSTLGSDYLKSLNAAPTTAGYATDFDTNPNKDYGNTNVKTNNTPTATEIIPDAEDYMTTRNEAPPEDKYAKVG